MLPNNPIAWAQFQLNGAWRNTLVFATLYAAGITTFFTLTGRFDPKGIGRGSVWLTILMGIQTAGLLLYAGSRIGMAIRNDLNSRMIESHRLMPISAPQAILGYLAGGSSQAMVLLAMNFFIGAGVCVFAGLQLNRWILGNAVLLVFAVFIWAMLALMSFAASRGRGGIGWIIAIPAISLSSGGMVTAIVPAVAILCSPLLGESIYVVKGGDTALQPIYGVSLIGQLCVGALFFFAAARKYRGASHGFTPVAALLLLLTGVGLSLYGVRQWNSFRPAFMDTLDSQVREVQTIASLVAMMLVALLALSASAREWGRWKRVRDQLGEPLGQARPMHPALMVLLAMAACFALPLLIEMEPRPQPSTFFLFQRGLGDRSAALLLTAGSLLGFGFVVSYLFRFLHRRRWKVLVPMAVFVVLLFVAPMLIDAALEATGDQRDPSGPSWIFAISPLGALVKQWADVPGGDPAPGVALLLVTGALLAAMYHATSPRRRPQSIDAPPAVPLPPAG